MVVISSMWSPPQRYMQGTILYIMWGTGKHGMCKETKLGRYCGFTAFPLLSEWFSYFVYDSMVQN